MPDDPRCAGRPASVLYDIVSFPRPPTPDRPSRVFTITVVVTAALSALTFGLSSSVSAHNTGSTGPTATVRHVADDAAPAIGLIGDSTLSGVRWFEQYGELQRFNFVFDAESCRRTIERSCWSREQYRPRNALTALQDEAGDWGEVLVVMTGYNDSAAGFTEGVTAVVDEARRQGITAVIWLSLRTKGVDYEEPLHLANGSTYRDANRSLYEIAGELNGYLQIADWATYSAESPEWFESDGAHLAEPGATALTEFIADQVDIVLAGGTITRTPAPWEEVRAGDDGELVVAVQRALIDADVDENIVDDGIYGPQTVSAVAEFQRTSGLVDSGAVDEQTAAALGLYDPPAPTTTSPTPSTTSAALPVPTTVAAAPDVAPDVAQREGLPITAWWMAVLAVPGIVWIARRRRSTDFRATTGAIPDPPEEHSDDRSVWDEPESTAIYNHRDGHQDLRRTPDIGR